MSGDVWETEVGMASLLLERNVRRCMGDRGEDGNLLQMVVGVIETMR
jgi:hypothetical protein